jgi:hypothetical protein
MADRECVLLGDGAGVAAGSFSSRLRAERWKDRAKQLGPVTTFCDINRRSAPVEGQTCR